MVKAHAQILCAGATREVTIEYKRDYYHVLWPWGMVTRVGKNYRLPGGDRALGNTRPVLLAAADSIEALGARQRAVVVRYCLRAGATDGELAWACRKMGVGQTTDRHAREHYTIVAQARRMAGLTT